MTYTITCDSGTIVLVSGESEESVEATWDAAVARGDAEPRINGTTERASRADIRACVANGHDYR